jgi:hypothetical protein
MSDHVVKVNFKSNRIFVPTCIAEIEFVNVFKNQESGICTDVSLKLV